GGLREGTGGRHHSGNSSGQDIAVASRYGLVFLNQTRDRASVPPSLYARRLASRRLWALPGGTARNRRIFRSSWKTSVPHPDRLFMPGRNKISMIIGVGWGLFKGTGERHDDI